jgi:biotin transport system substrate-specific component
MQTDLSPRSWPVLVPALPHLGNAALVVGASLFVALMAQARIDLPFSPVPITGQTFAVLLVGAALGARRGAAAVAAYVLQGAVGLPVYAGGTAGLAILFGPTGGYLAGFVVAAWLVGWLAERGFDRRIHTALAAFLVGEAAIFACGLAVLAAFVGVERVVTLGLLPFIPGEVVKLAGAGLALPAAWQVVRRARG